MITTILATKGGTGGTPGGVPFTPTAEMVLVLYFGCIVLVALFGLALLLDRYMNRDE